MSKKTNSQLSTKNTLSKTDFDGACYTITPELRQQIQVALLSMYLDVAAVCEKYKIMLFLCGGSALGSVRHRGFIPWDDDLDVSMTRADYNRFRDIFEEELSSRYHLCAPDFKQGSRTRFPKVMKKGTLFREIGNPSPEEECGLFLDIFILDNAPKKGLYRMIKGSVCNILEFISGQVLLREEKAYVILQEIKKTSKSQYLLRRFVGHIFSFRSARAWNRTLDRAIQYRKPSEYCALATGRKHYFGELFPRDVFLPGKPSTFEGKKVLLFSDTDTYLRNLYGDYMMIPPEEERERHVLEEIRL